MRWVRNFFVDLFYAMKPHKGFAVRFGKLTSIVILFLILFVFNREIAEYFTGDMTWFFGEVKGWFNNTMSRLTLGLLSCIVMGLGVIATKLITDVFKWLFYGK